MKEVIDVFDKKGNHKKAEVMLRFKDEQNNNYYIVYKYSNEYYAAKYDDVVGLSKLDTNLNETELKALERIVNEMPGV